MPPEVPVHALMDEALIEQDAMWRRAMHPDSPGGIEIVDGESRLIRLHYYRSLAPRCLTGSDSLRVIGSITRSSQGVTGHRPMRHINNVIRIRGRAKSDEVVPA